MGASFAPQVISDAGAANTYQRLLPPDLPALNQLRGQLRRLEPSTAHISLYVGLAKSDAELGLSGTNLWVYPSFDHDANVRRFTHDFPRDIEAPFPGVYLSFPSAKDPEVPEAASGQEHGGGDDDASLTRPSPPGSRHAGSGGARSMKR